MSTGESQPARVRRYLRLLSSAARELPRAPRAELLAALYLLVVGRTAPSSL